MKKYIWLGWMSILLVLVYSYILFLTVRAGDSWMLVVVLVICLGINGLVAYKSLRQPLAKRSFGLYSLAVFGTLYLLAWFMLGMFLLNIKVYLVVTLAMTVVGFVLYKRFSVVWAIGVVGLVLLVSGFGIASNFEENYCEQLGYRVDQYSQKVIVATAEDAHFLKTFNVKEGDKIGLAFRTHMLCHVDFDFVAAMRKSILEQ